jgi:hypothetical protein
VPSSAKQRGLSEREALASIFSCQRKNQKKKNKEIFILGAADETVENHRCYKYVSQNQ